MGGENDIRGYDIRSISPVTFIPVASAQAITYHDPTCGGCLRSFTIPVLVYTATLPGGDVQGSGNIEYSIPIVGPVTARLFFDGGTEGVVRRDGLRLDAAGFSVLAAHLPNAGLTNRPPIPPRTHFPLPRSNWIGINR